MHGKSSHYAFQLKKCTEPNCAFCSLNPSRLSEDHQDLTFLPDPMWDESGQKYMDFEKVHFELFCTQSLWFLNLVSNQAWAADCYHQARLSLPEDSITRFVGTHFDQDGKLWKTIFNRI